MKISTANSKIVIFCQKVNFCGIREITTVIRNAHINRKSSVKSRVTNETKI